MICAMPSMDSLFYIVEGNLLMDIEHEEKIYEDSASIYCKMGVIHRVSTDDECLIMQIESKTTELNILVV